MRTFLCASLISVVLFPACKGGTGDAPAGGQANGSLQPAVVQPAAVQPAAVQPPAPPPATAESLVPPPLSQDERVARFRAGNGKLAARLNNEGLVLRKNKKPGVMDKYRAAIEADPSFPWARFNLACELALAGQKDEAMDQLRELFRMETADADYALLKSEADRDLVSLRGDPRLLALLDAAARRRPLRLEEAEKEGCSGWASDGTVACGWRCEGMGESRTGLVLLRPKGASGNSVVLPDGRGGARAVREKARKTLSDAAVPARALPSWPLRPEATTDLAAGYSVTWKGDRLRVRGPGGEVEAGPFLGCTEELKADAPGEVHAYLVPSLGVVVLQGISSYSFDANDHGEGDSEYVQVRSSGYSHVQLGKAPGPVATP